MNIIQYSINPITMSFKCAEGNTVSYHLDDPIDGLITEQVSTFMDHMIAADAFDIRGGLREKVSAKIVTTTNKKLF